MVSFILNILITLLFLQVDAYTPNPLRSDHTTELNRSLLNLGYDTGLANQFINTCKLYENGITSAKNCVIRIASIGLAESGKCKHGISYDCWGLMSKGKVIGFQNSQSSINFWVNNYYKYRWSNKTATQWINRSHYCIGDCGNFKVNVTWGINYFRSLALY